jgi:hypothetical protein
MNPQHGCISGVALFRRLVDPGNGTPHGDFVRDGEARLGGRAGAALPRISADHIFYEAGWAQVQVQVQVNDVLQRALQLGPEKRAPYLDGGAADTDLRREESLLAAAAQARSSFLQSPPAVSQIVPKVAPAWQRIVERCLEKDREQRFQSAAGLAFACAVGIEQHKRPHRTNCIASAPVVDLRRNRNRVPSCAPVLL